MKALQRIIKKNRKQEEEKKWLHVYVLYKTLKIKSFQMQRNAKPNGPIFALHMILNQMLLKHS